MRGNPIVPIISSNSKSRKCQAINAAPSINVANVSYVTDREADGISHWLSSFIMRNCAKNTPKLLKA